MEIHDNDLIGDKNMLTNFSRFILHGLQSLLPLQAISVQNKDHMVKEKNLNKKYEIWQT